MFTPKANLKQKKVKNSEILYEGSGSLKSRHDFRNRGTFLCPEITEHSSSKIAAQLQKSQHDFDSIRSKI